jgi:hypothetical protein
MKTLIITGTAKPTETGVMFDIVLYGQSVEHHEVQYITWFKGEFLCNAAMEKRARELYVDYFKTDGFNIISMQNITLIN